LLLLRRVTMPHYAWVLVDDPTPDVSNNATLNELLFDGLQYSAVTAMGFFTAFLISWFISSRFSRCIVNAMCWVLGCESRIGNQCCEDAPEHAAEDEEPLLGGDKSDMAESHALISHQPKKDPEAAVSLAPPGPPKMAHGQMGTREMGEKK
jgi:hypothetical protein